MKDTLLRDLRRFADSVAGREILSPQQRRRINTAATLPDEFLHVVARALEAIPQYGEMARLSTEEIQDAVAFSNEHEAVAEELEQLARQIRDRVVTRRADVGQRALLVYALAKRSDDENVIVHTERMRRHLRPRR